MPRTFGAWFSAPWRPIYTSTTQYASRRCAPDREHERLVDDLRAGPFVFVGTTLDEALLWKHVQLEKLANGDGPRRHSFLVAPALTRARQILWPAIAFTGCR